MINLSRIPDDKSWGVICNTEQELREFVEAIKSQRPDIQIGSFRNSSKLSEEYYHGKAYFLNYRDSHNLQHGLPGNLPENLHTLTFDELLTAPELPDIDANLLESLSTLGL